MITVGFFARSPEMKAVAVAFSIAWQEADVEPARAGPWPGRGRPWSGWGPSAASCTDA